MLDGLPPPLLVHAPATLRRLGLRPRPGLDLLELFAFACPARTPRADAARPVPGARPRSARPRPRRRRRPRCRTSPRPCSAGSPPGATLPANRDAAGIAARMGRAGWGWAPFVLAALGQPDAAPSPEALQVWKRLPEWEEAAPPPPPAAHPVTEAEARARLAAILGRQRRAAPGAGRLRRRAARPPSRRASSGATRISCWPRRAPAPARRSATSPRPACGPRRTRGSVWISTFTRHLQRQIDGELTRLFPDPAERRRRVVVRKGRENYLCLLNLEDARHAARSPAPRRR